jgi:hypothetical protein
MITMKITIKNKADPIVWTETKDAVPCHDEHFCHFEQEEGVTTYIPMTSIESFTLIST